LIPVVTPTTFLTGGKDSPVTDAETAANQTAAPFGYATYQGMLKAIDVPAVVSAADISQYINESDKYCVVNGKLLIISGTNLVAFNKIYALTQSVTTTKSIVAAMVTKRPTLLTTQNVSTTRYEVVCGQTQPYVTVEEVYRDLDTSCRTSAARWGDLSSLSHYIVWGTTYDPTRANYDKILRWGFPDEFIGAILTGETPTTSDVVTDVSTPTVLITDDLTVLTGLKFTDAELEELFLLNIPGVKIPYLQSMADTTMAFDALVKPRPRRRTNGTVTGTKTPLVAIQSVNVANILRDDDLSSELTTRGKACARLSARLPTGFPSASLPDLPNLPFDQLPDPAKKIESAFAALSSAISMANRVFDMMVGAMQKTVSGILNKIQNLQSMAENVFKNALIDCLLGAGTAAIGKPEYTGPGGGGGSSIPSLKSLTGGLPIPMSLLATAFKKMSLALDFAITAAFSAMMKTIQKPMCIVTQLLGSIQGIDLGGLTNPCKAAKPDNCPAESTQGVVDASTSMTQQLGQIDSLTGFPTTNPVQTVNESVQQFTGVVQKTMTETTQQVQRGVQAVMQDIQKSVASKLALVEQLDKAIKELFGDVKDTTISVDEANAKQSGCNPPSLGIFTDSVTKYL
jgi:hypothetical protein